MEDKTLANNYEDKKEGEEKGTHTKKKKKEKGFDSQSTPSPRG